MVHIPRSIYGPFSVKIPRTIRLECMQIQFPNSTPLDYLEQAYSDLDYIGGEGDAMLKRVQTELSDIECFWQLLTAETLSKSNNLLINYGP